MKMAAGPRLFSQWRWFPMALLGALAVVCAVNGAMIYFAVATFPGEAGQDGFDLSNAYDRVLALSRQQAALGWRVVAEAGPEGHVVVHATDRAGMDLPGAAVVARAERPVGPKLETALILHAEGAGRFSSDQVLASGRWAVSVTVERGGDTLSMTGQLVLP